MAAQEETDSVPEPSASQSEVNSVTSASIDPSSFSTYAEFLRHLDPSLKGPGHQVLVNYLEKTRLHGTVHYEKPCNTVLRISPEQLHIYDCRIDAQSVASYRHFLSHYDEGFESQIIIRSRSYGRLRQGLQSSLPFLPEEVDALGLELGISPVFWYSVLSESTGNPIEFSARPKEWIGAERFLRIGYYYLVMPTPKSGSKPVTVILFSDPLHTDHNIDLLKLDSLISRVTDKTLKHTGMQSNQTWPHPLVNTIGSRRQGGSNLTRNFQGNSTVNIPFLCLSELVRLHMQVNRSLQEGRPCFVIDHQSWNGPHSLRFWDRKSRRFPYTFEQPSLFPISELQEHWIALRLQLDACKKTLLLLPDFVSKNFEMENEDAEKFYQGIKAEFENSIEELAMTESLVKDEIGMISSAIATEMAQISIKESKRVMLLSGLAFVFLPASLAGTVFGMNIQQINQSGHDISVFIATSFVMVASTLLLWALSHSFVSYRRKVNQEWLDSLKEPWERRTWKQRALFIDLNGDRVQWWFRDDEGLLVWKRYLQHLQQSLAACYQIICNSCFRPLLELVKLGGTRRDGVSETSRSNSESA